PAAVAAVRVPVRSAAGRLDAGRGGGGVRPRGRPRPARAPALLRTVPEPEPGGPGTGMGIGRPAADGGDGDCGDTLDRRGCVVDGAAGAVGGGVRVHGVRVFVPAVRAAGGRVRLPG